MTARTSLQRLVAVTLVMGLGQACSPQHAKNIVPTLQAETCLSGERGYFRASLRGAIDAELDWRGATLQCEGGARPDGRGLRLSFLGPADAQGRRLRLVFGVAAQPGRGESRAAPVNVTVIVEDQDRLYATQGDDKCTVETLVQEPVAAINLAGAPAASHISSHIYRVAARGYCIDPAATLDGRERLYINRFDFTGVARFEDNELHAETPHA